MLEWSDVDLAVRDAVREFVDKEIRPHLDALESGDMPPYPIIRKLFSTFGIDDDGAGVAREAAGQMRDGTVVIGESSVGGGMFGGGTARRAWASLWSASSAGCPWASSPGMGVSLV